MGSEDLDQIDTGLAESNPPCLWCRHILARRKKRFSLADGADFVLDDNHSWPCQDIDFSRFTPYAFQYDADSFLFVDTPREVLESPFFYLGQFKLARQAVSIERSQLTDRLGGTEAARAKRPTFLFSIGRCGSTLLSRIAGAAGMFQISEPDIFTGIVNRGNDPRVGEVLCNALLALERYAAAGDDRVLIKLRSQSCRSARHFVSALPDARYLFLKRDLHEWATSFISKFNWQTRDLGRALALGYRAYRTFVAAGVDLAVIEYDALVHDPVSVAGRFFAEDTSPALVQRAIGDVLSKDSQAGAGIRVGDDRQAVVRRVDAFLGDWRRNASADMQRFYAGTG